MPSLVRGRIRHFARRITMSSFVRPRTQEDRNARLLYLSTAMIGVPLGGIMAFMPVFLARQGADSSLIGWLTSAPALLSIFLLIPGAAIAERGADQVRVRVLYGRIMRLSYLVCALVPFVLPSDLWPIAIVLVWALRAFPNAVAMPAWTVALSQAVSPRKRARLNATRWALLSIVSAASSAAFGTLLDLIFYPLNYQIVFLVSFAVAWLDPLIFSRIVVPPLQKAPAISDASVLDRFLAYVRPVTKSRGFLRFLAATILYRVALNVPAPLFSVFWVNELQASDTLIGLRGTVGHAALVVGYMLWGRAANRLGHRRVMTLSALGLAVYPVLTSFAREAVWLLPIAVIWGLTVSGIDIGLFDLMLAAIPKQRQPLFAAVWSMVSNAAMFLGPMIGASLADATSTGTALIIAGVAQTLTIIPFILLPKDV